MSRLVRLYPAAWRDRYGEEFEALLAERPPSLSDRLDVVRGALDARLDPQVAPAPPEPGHVPPLASPFPGLLVGLGGVLWAVTWLIVGTARITPTGDLDGGAAIPVFLAALLLLAAGNGAALQGLPAGAQRRAAVGLLTFTACVASFWVLPWELIWLPSLGGIGLFLVGGPALAVLGARAGRIPGWVARAVAGATAAIVVGMGALFALTPGRDLFSPVVYIAIYVPLGVAWALVGLHLALAGRTAGTGSVPGGTAS